MLNIIKGLSQAKALGHNTLLQELCSKLTCVLLDCSSEHYNQIWKLKTIHITRSVNTLYIISEKEDYSFKFLFGSLPLKTAVWKA